MTPHSALRTPHFDYYTALYALIRPRRASDLPLTLAPMRALLAALGNPERRYPVIVVAGSVGKGTMALRLAAGLASAGLRAGLYTGPHLHSFRERFVIWQGTQSTPISPDAFTAHAGRVLAAARAVGQSPSTFESATTLAYDWFAAEAVDYAVCEIGLGGRFDAVNAAPHDLALIGPIELEHAAMLGGTLERIAWHKGGVISANGTAFIVPPTDPAVRAVFAAEGQAQQAAWIETPDPAGAALDWLKDSGRVPASASIPAELALPGRLERVNARGKRVLIDGGHTPLAAARLAAAISPHLTGGVRLIVGMLADKDAAAYLDPLDLPGLTIVCTTVPAGRALPATVLAASFVPVHARLEIMPSLTAALDHAFAAPEPIIAIAGSLRMAAAAREALGLLDEAALEEARRTRALFEGPEYRARL